MSTFVFLRGRHLSGPEMKRRSTIQAGMLKELYSKVNNLTIESRVTQAAHRNMNRNNLGFSDWKENLMNLLIIKSIVLRFNNRQRCLKSKFKMLMNPVSISLNIPIYKSLRSLRTPTLSQKWAQTRSFTTVRVPYRCSQCQRTSRSSRWTTS